MDIKLQREDSFRITADHRGNNFIDVAQVGYESMAVDLFAHFVYIEIRKKEDRLRVFTFAKKSLKKECDFGWWGNADVVFALNEQVINK